MRSAALLVLVVVAACGGGDTFSTITVTAEFPVTRMSGTGQSPLDPLVGQTIAVDVVLDAFDVGHGQRTDCRTTIYEQVDPRRTASGPTAALVQEQILDPLTDWDVRIELCGDPSLSTIVLESVIDPLNLSFGCAGVPVEAQVVDDNHDPVLTSFTATSCTSIVLDVVANREFGDNGFAMSFVTGS